ncbi:allene oxide synthase-lipoxygenase protein-like [Ostrea edulis]|uniref:allene oxide synthase-lipoxygenase protein-like n=1 Tax=Ostrea edulis TaxID=37623 RepID=UPI0024AF5058|nr:allene oxide synthase-lipoxygenase protein-like [Ostrea edulis]XP_056021363.1 allene oxide synthase-lipoxygenase protein-like [Ostrea edulis]XP_056021364.1 allene oxide synthase-lipoxygenase protein-like [Ostrea edulis]
MTTYDIKVKTGDRAGAGTDANTQIVLLDNSGKKTKPATLDNWFRNDFERNQIDVFTIIDDTDIPEVTEIQLRRDEAGLYSDWFVEKVEVTNQKSGKTSVFPILRWIRPGVDTYFGRHDTFLPQSDPRPKQRNSELEEKRKLYEYEEKIPNLPVQIKKVPDDEMFSDGAKWDLLKRKYTLIAGKALEMVFGDGSWETLDDLKGVYSKSFGIPKGMEDWESDVSFGWQRLNSVNPNLIRLCTEIPNKFGVTEEMIKPFLEGLTISQAIADKRLFIIDLDILEGLSLVEGYICPLPIALFFVDGKGQLMPVAIQLFQQKGPDNPVFIPSDPPYTWLIAKMWYNVGDSNYHQAITHLGYTHLLMEGICVASNRCLSPSHPMFKLMAPHFLYIIAINDRALNFLVSPGGWIDKTMVVGSKGVLELAIKGTGSWRLDVEGTYPEFLKQRGLYPTDGKLLPTFYQRDDSLDLYEAIRSYVTKYVKLYYDTDEKITNDPEIQNFGREITLDKSKGGCGISGVPLTNGKFTSAEQLILVFTSVIFNSSVVHAAANFPQYDAYGFPPNYPTKIKGNPPKDKTPLQEGEIVKALLDRSTTLDTMIITTILSARSTNALGDFEVEYVYDPAAVALVEEFRKDLKRISAKIRNRNEKMSRKYEYLLPEEVPNSISI